jgi:peroxiredoxin Q/BCP
LSDPTTETAQAYGLVKPGGKNAARVTVYVGKDGKILAIDEKVSAATHGEDIAKKLEALGVEKK